MDSAVEMVEFGVLDRLDDAVIARMAPSPAEARLVTRLADGREVIVRRDLVHERLQFLLDTIAADAYRCTVLLCTGHFPGLRAEGLFLDAQSIVDHTVRSVTGHAKRVGVMLPVREQIAEFHFTPAPGQELMAAAASPYRADDFARAAHELTDADLVVMHCMGYTEAMRRSVAAVTGRPVLLARRLVASAVSQLL